MRGKGQLLISTLLFFFLNALAKNADAHATGDSESAEGGKVRAPSSASTSPGVGISSSSSSSSSGGGGGGSSGGSGAFRAPEAMNEVLDAMQTKLAPSFAPGLAHSRLFFTNHAHKLPLQTAYPTSPIRTLSSSPSSSSRPGSPGQGGNNDSEEKWENSSLGHYHRHYRRVRRGGYTVPYFVGKRFLDEDTRTNLELEFQKRNALKENSLPADQEESLNLDREDLSLLTGKRAAPMFVGKRSVGHQLQEDPREKRQVPYFVGKRALEESESLEQEELQKRDVSGGDSADDLTELQEPQLEASDLGNQDDAAADPDKRHSPLFVGKRGVPYFIGKRGAPYFIGKRGAPYFVGKRGVPYFVGKRGAPYFVGKRGAPYFVGKRGAPYFVGKRWVPYFVGKRGAPYFVGKRWVPYFVGKRQASELDGGQTFPAVSSRAAPLFIGRRGFAPLFVGKRGAPLFIGKRADDEPTSATDKRRAPMFVGKRTSNDWNELLSALRTLRAARHYRRMIQADKRHNAPFFIGRRSSPDSPADVTHDTPEVQSDNYFR